MGSTSPLQGTAITLGKGRFGKRPPSFTIERGGSSCDSSNDSGLECDFNSESQFSWCSGEDSHTSRSSFSSMPAFLDSSRSESKEERISKRPTNIVNIVPKPDRADLINLDSNTAFAHSSKISSQETATMSPDSTVVGMPVAPFSQISRVHRSPDGATHNMATTPSAMTSPVPIKRAKFCFSTPNTLMKGLKLRNQNQNQNQQSAPARGNIGKRLPTGTIPALATTSLSSVTSDRRTHLQVLAQPEEQHRARYQTEGSRGAIKDRKGNGFPTVKLTGYDKPATLQIFIGTDQGKVSPHIFYQACKVTGKSSTPCIEKKVEGTILIEIEFEPSKDMVISCDCVGILKERNVDVEQRFPFHHASQSRKKSTKCRMIFRTTIVNSLGIEETLQAASLPILCTQPPGLPEVCKQSLYESPAKGGLEMFLIGKNFTKDTKAVFQEEDEEGRIVWEAISEPQKDFLQQSHAICNVPAYKDELLLEPVECKVSVVSGGKQSEPHRFTYLPNVTPVPFGPTSIGSIMRGPNAPENGIPTSRAQSLTTTQQLEPAALQAAVDLMPCESDLQNAVGTICETPVTEQQQIQLCATLNSVPLAEQLTMNAQPSTMEPIQSISFDTNIIPPTTPQERQVVNELQCILEQTNSQNSNGHKSDELMSNVNVMEMKPFVLSNLDHNINANDALSVESGVPLDLQFPPQVETATTTASVVQFPEQRMHNVNPFLSGSAQMACSTVAGLTHMLGRPGTNMGRGSLNAAMIPVLLGTHHSLVRPFCTNSIAARRVQSMPNVNGENLNLMVNVADCSDQGMLKVEPLSPNHVPMSTAGIMPQQMGAMVPNNNVMNFMGGELQTHQGSIAKELASMSDMSDSELLNYINPGCFDQGHI